MFVMSYLFQLMGIGQTGARGAHAQWHVAAGYKIGQGHVRTQLLLMLDRIVPGAEMRIQYAQPQTVQVIWYYALNSNFNMKKKPLKHLLLKRRHHHASKYKYTNGKKKLQVYCKKKK